MRQRANSDERIPERNESDEDGSERDEDEQSERKREGRDDERGGKDAARKHATFSSWVVTGRDDRLSAFARSTRGDLVAAWQIGPKDDWVGWLGIGGDSEGLPVVARDREGNTSVFALRSDGRIETSTQSRSGKWSKWKSLQGKVASRPAALELGNGALMLFAAGEDGKL